MTITLTLTLYAIAAAWLAYLAVTAPEGWQDADGFHFGRKDDA